MSHRREERPRSFATEQPGINFGSVKSHLTIELIDEIYPAERRGKLADAIHDGHLREATAFSQNNFLFAAKPRNNARSHQTCSACARTATITVTALAPLAEAADQER